MGVASMFCLPGRRREPENAMSARAIGRSCGTHYTQPMESWEPVNAVVDPHGREATLTSLFYLGRSPDLSPLALFSLLSHPQPGMTLRDLEPPVGYFLRHAHFANDSFGLQHALDGDLLCQDWAGVQRGGYLLDLLCYFSPDFREWQKVMLPWLDDVAKSLPSGASLVPFFPADSRNTPNDALAARWRLSSGMLYDRLGRLLKPPYVC